MRDDQEIRNNRIDDEPYYSIMEMANDGIVVIQDDRIALVNRAFQSLVGISEEELIGKIFERLMDPMAVPFFRENRDSYIWGEPRRPSFQTRLLDKDRRIIDVEMSISDFILDGDPAVVAIVRDITERLKLEAAIESSEDRYRELYDSSPIAYFTLTQRGVIQQVNKAALNLLEYDSDTILRRNISSLLVSTDAAGDVGKQVISEVLQGKQIRDIEIQMKKSDGSSIWTSVTSQLLVGSDSQTRIGFMAVNIDRRKMAEEREKTERERANLYLEVMTHDLNNVNQSLLFSMGLIDEALELPERVQNLIAETNWNIRRAARMIANLRTIFTLRDSPPQKEQADLFPFLIRSVAAVERDFPWKKLVVNSNIVKEQYTVAGHSFLEQVFFNIIHNSVMHGNGNEIIIDVNAEIIDSGDNIRIEFSDSGPGISDSLKEYIFKRTGAPDHQIVGRGLGLTLVDRIVKDLRGNMWAEDRVKGNSTQGVRFVLVLPSWTTKVELECGQEYCISFYKSDNCLFCDPTYEILTGVMEEMSLPLSLIQSINVDDPTASISGDDIPMLPLVRICDVEIIGFADVHQVRSALAKMVLTADFPHKDKGL
ncbi:MAG: PAS domain-containing sensor histidine kinase [Candidatus Thorarchaeota archaeon]